MKRVWLIFLLLLSLAFVVACRRTVEPEVEIGAIGTFVPGVVQPQRVTLAELAAAPAAYQDTLVQVTGRYDTLPRLVCLGSRPRQSPASWALTDGPVVTHVGRFSDEVNGLVPRGLTMTVEGVWRFWEGSVGCGKHAITQQFWYLEATDIIAPDPVVRVTLTPGGVVEATAPLATPAGTEVAELATEPPTEVIATPTPETVLATATPEEEEPGPIGPPATAPPVPTPGGNPVTITPLPSPTLGSTAGTPSPAPSATSDAGGTDEGTATPTATAEPGASPQATGSATPTGSALPGTDMGNISFFSLWNEFLDVDAEHRMRFEITSTQAITLHMTMPPDFNPTFRIFNENGNVVVDQDNSPPGQVERLNNHQLTGPGIYYIVAHETSGQESEYAMTLFVRPNSSQPRIYFGDPLAYNQSNTGQLTEGPSVPYHFWHFYGEMDDMVTIRVTPSDDSDIVFDIFTPSLGYLLDFEIDEGGSGEAEEVTATLTETGLYTIQVSEFYGEPSNYTIQLEDES